MEPTIDAVDWCAPWLLPYAAEGRRVAARVGAGASVAAALDAETGAGAPRFVGMEALARGEPYECCIARTGSVPTRDRLHDLLNGLVWLVEPVLKRAIAERHAAQIMACGVGPRRGRARDRLTLIDENGALLTGAPPALVDALRRRDWQALFVTGRGLWSGARLRVVGHGLLERLVHPRPAITAHVVVCGDGADAIDGLDATDPLLPLPVLGVPGWWPANAEPAFYADASVFRPPRCDTGDDRVAVLKRPRTSRYSPSSSIRSAP